MDWAVTAIHLNVENHCFKGMFNRDIAQLGKAKKTAPRAVTLVGYFTDVLAM